MSGESSDELLQRVRGGELDARRVLVTPDAAPGTADLTLESLLDGGAVARRARGERVGAARRSPRRPHRRPRRRPPLLDRRPAQLLADRAARRVAGDLAAATACTRRRPTSTSGPARSRFAACGSRCSRPARTAARASSTSPADTAARCASSGPPFPDAKLVACDISRDAVDFCAQEFGAIPVYSQEDPAAIELPGPFDVIWVGSLFTHVPEPRWIAFLDLLASVLSEDGLLVFTVQGRNVRRQLAVRPARDGTSTEAGVEQIVRGYDEHGFGYADWSGASGYGTSLNRPSWVTRQIEERPGLRLVGYREIGWGRQDVVTCQATGEVSARRPRRRRCVRARARGLRPRARRAVLHPRPRPAGGRALAAPRRGLGAGRHDPDRPVASRRSGSREAAAASTCTSRCRSPDAEFDADGRGAARARPRGPGARVRAARRRERPTAGRPTSTIPTVTWSSSGPPTWATTRR